MSIRLHGNPPYTVSVIHGGPGAPGSVMDFARDLAVYTGTGVSEPLQTRHCIDGLAEELHAQLAEYASLPCVLIGHSWGAWLAVFAAARYPRLAKCVILVGTGPLQTRYVPSIGERRKANLSPAEGQELEQLLQNMPQDEAFARIGALCDKADSYDLMDIGASPVKPDSAAYDAIWPEAAQARATGALMEAVRRIQCPIIVCHGEQDPHPPEGLWEPLTEAGIPFAGHLLPKCGHSPWKERNAREPFFRLLQDIIAGSPGKE